MGERPATTERRISTISGPANPSLMTERAESSGASSTVSWREGSEQGVRVEQATVDPRRRVPRTDAVLADPRLVAAAATPRPAAGQGRGRRRAGAGPARRDRRRPRSPTPPWPRCRTRAGGLRPVLNATGVVLHTNLGRAPLSGRRGRGGRRRGRAHRRRARPRHRAPGPARPRPRWPRWPPRSRTPATCTWSTTARPRWCWPPPRSPPAGRSSSAAASWSRSATGSGCPTCSASTGARLREVGTTNRTDARRLRRGDRPGHRLRAQGAPVELRGARLHRAGRRSPSWPTLAAPVVVDIGSGLLAPDPLLPDEPDAATALRAGAALVTASGDKLLGGPQAGLLLGDAGARRAAAPAPAGPRAAGRQAHPGRAARRPCAGRRRRPGRRCTPTRTSCGRGPSGCARRWPRPASTPRWCASVAVVGGGGAPGVELPSWALSLPAAYAAPLRLGDPPVVGRVERGRLLLDLRCVPPDADPALRGRGAAPSRGR